MSEPLRAMMIGAHPDDVDICTCGITKRLVSKGCIVRFVSMTTGNAGHQTMRGEELIKTRAAEAQKSAAYLGATYEILPFDDGRLTPSLEARETLMRTIRNFKPDMIGIGPYITHAQTPFANEKSGSLELTLRLLSILRLLFPYALLPSTTALGTIHPQGRELGLKAGGNVVMPNLSPVRVRKLYELYENKICTGEEAAQCRGCLEQRVKSAGYEIVTARGDVKR